MQHVKQPILTKTEVAGLAVNIQRTGLCLGDPMQLHSETDGRIGVYTTRRPALFGIIPRRRPLYIGHLGPRATKVVEPFLLGAHDLRVRIVGLTPEHLAAAAGPEVFVSVWGEVHDAIPASAGPYLPQR